MFMIELDCKMCLGDCRRIKLSWIFLLWIPLINVDAKRSIVYDFPGPSCGYQQREIDGIVLHSSHSPLYANSACIMHFESDDDTITTKKLMLNFPRFNITDCSVVLKIYYSSGAVGQPDVQLGCRTSRPPVLYSVGRHVTLRLDKTTNSGYDFDIVITTFRYGSYCKEFHCRNDKCIDRDLMCDGVDNCFDNSDELACYGHIPRGNYYPGVTRNKMWLVFSTSVILVAIFIAVCVTGVCIYRRRRRYHATSQGQVIRLQPQSLPPQQQPFCAVQPLPSQPPPAYSKPLPTYSAGPSAPYPVGPQAYYPGSYPVQAAGYPDQPSGYPGNPSGYPVPPYSGYQGYGPVPPAAPGYQP